MDDIAYTTSLFSIIVASIPGSLGMLFRKLTDVMNYMTLGRLNDPGLLSGAGLGIITVSTTTIGLGIGITGGIETLSSQAFGNKNNYLAG